MGDKEVEKKIEEGLIPELGGKIIKVGTFDLHITEMPIFYVKQLNRMMQPIYDLVGGKKDVKLEDLINVSKIEEFYDNLLTMAALITERINPEINRDYLEKNVGEGTLLRIIHTQLEVNGLINFFRDILGGVLETLVKEKMNT